MLFRSRVLSIKKFRTALFNATAPIHRLFLDKYGIHFVTKDLILAYNFAMLVPTLGASILAHAADVAAKVAGAVVGAYITEKVCEKAIPKALDLMRDSLKTEDTSTPAMPKIDTSNEEFPLPGMPPPNAGELNVAPISPIIADTGEEAIHKNSDPTFMVDFTVRLKIF